MQNNFLKKITFILSAIILALLLYPSGYYVLNDSRAVPYTEPENCQFKGVGVYIINLDRSPERYANVCSNIEALGFPMERISAVDGNKLSDEEIQKNVDIEFYRKYMGHYPKVGTIGCSLSHIQTWQRFLNSTYEYALIFEDDIIFEKQVLKETVDELIKYKNFWDVCSFEISHHGRPLKIKELSQNKQLVVYLGKVTHSGAYIVNRKAVRHYLQKALPIKMPIDYYFTRGWELNIKFTGLENPRLVKQNQLHSFIKESKIFSGKINKTIFEKSVNIYKIKSYVATLFYNFKLYGEVF